MPATDPMAYDEFGSERDRIKRQLAMASELRRNSQQPEGKMVGNWFVRPSKLTGLANLGQQVFAGMQERRANQDQQNLDQRMGDEYSSWMAQRPQSKMVGTPEEIPGTVAPGPMPEGMEGTPLMKTRLAMEKVEPTQAQTIDWASKGMRNPLSKALASHYMEDAIVKQPEREAARTFKAEEAEKLRDFKLEQDIQRHKNKLGELDLLYGDKTKTREQLMVIEKMKDQTKRDLGFAEAEARVKAAEAKAKASGANVKPVPNTITTKMSEAEQAADGFNGAYSTYKPEYGGLKGQAMAAGGRSDIATMITGAIAPEMAQKMREAASWWSNYESQVAMIQRHAMFGSAFTEQERAAWDKATIKPGDPPEFIADKIREKTRLSNIFYNKLRNQYVTTGHTSIGDAFPERGTMFEESAGGPSPGVPPVPLRQPVVAPTQRRRSTDLPRGVVSFEQE